MRPDIAHQCLLTLLDSPLNKSGHLQVFVHTEKNVLIEVNPHTRIPRTYKRFAGLMVQLLHKLSIRATDGPDRLLKVIKNPVTDHLPPGCRKIGFSFDAKRTVQFSEYIKTLPPTDPVAFIVGAFAHGEIDEDYCEESIAISEYPLSASVACGKLCAGFEDLWGIL
ncbi:C2f protein, variant [Capsaspora owczarzaki ATCC 30864]|nr:C2f protein, variant [Capsaspora owczarzaki ATCC 30864]